MSRPEIGCSGVVPSLFGKKGRECWRSYVTSMLGCSVSLSSLKHTRNGVGGRCQGFLKKSAAFIRARVMNAETLVIRVDRRRGCVSTLCSTIMSEGAAMPWSCGVATLCSSVLVGDRCLVTGGCTLCSTVIGMGTKLVCGRAGTYWRDAGT